MKYSVERCRQFLYKVKFYGDRRVEYLKEPATRKDSQQKESYAIPTQSHRVCNPCKQQNVHFSRLNEQTVEDNSSRISLEENSAPIKSPQA